MTEHTFLITEEFTVIRRYEFTTETEDAGAAAEEARVTVLPEQVYHDEWEFETVYAKRLK